MAVILLLQALQLLLSNLQIVAVIITMPAVVFLKLNSPAAIFGTYQIKIVDGSDGNTVIDECNQEIPPGTAFILKLNSCNISVPSAFTPNGDGVNDFLYPLNAYNASQLEFRIYNRYGSLLFQTKEWTKKWNGTVNGILQQTGTYIWTLEYTDKDTGKTFFLKGTSVLIR